MMTEINLLNNQSEDVPVVKEQERVNPQLIAPHSISERELDTSVITENSSSYQNIVNGWILANETWVYYSVDAPTGVITVPSGAASKYNVGDRVKMTNSTVKYFIITAVSDTTLTLYGGTDYTLENADITLNYYSHAKSPLGFPMSPTKWTQTFSSTSDLSQSSPATTTWYNVSASLTIPIGSWRVEYNATLLADYSTTVTAIAKATLSTTTNSESDTSMTSALSLVGVTDQIANVVTKSRIIDLTSKTTYYLLCYQTGQSPATSILFWGSQAATVIRAVCAYL